MKTKGTALNNLPLQHVSRVLKGSETESEVKAAKQIAALLHKTKDTVQTWERKGKKCMLLVIVGSNPDRKRALATVCDYSVHHNLQF